MPDELMFDHGGIQIYCGDSRRIMPGLGDVDHVITDPPYAEQTHAGARSLTDIDAPMVSFDSISEGELRGAFVEMARHVRRWCIATVDYHHMPMLEALEAMRFVRFGVWVKPNGAPQFSGDRPAQGWEAVAILHGVREAPRWNSGGDRAVWTANIARDAGNPNPTAKPIALVKQWIEQFTDPGDLILDPYMGSGTTLRAAKDLGRRAIGIEIKRDQCDYAADRLRQEVLI